MGYRKMPWQKPLNDLVKVIISCIDDMTETDLEQLLAACGKVTETNCGWQEYKMAGIVRHYVKYRLDKITANKEVTN